jgi:DNA polymerase-3 subunit gamma/tau
MSYQVLARKWRPRRFAELVGQEHVVRALTHALDTGRIHHAFLFTGTRGVGKTTIARIFAKSLNCEKGVSSNPCGECGACRDIDAGRYLDLLEIDAASNTGVDDVREVIENAQYAPARGKYKVYLVDEVHMLSRSAFNALLKTLEEPPPHVKFLLATTDPQKLPVTVLSRCLQFHLKRLSDAQIAAQVTRILQAEEVVHDADSVREIARAGNGSLRDALSLLDQAISYGGGALRADDVRAMLGTLDRGRVAALLAALADGDAAALMAQVEEVAEFAPDFESVLDELALLLHRVQLRQLAAIESDEDGAATVAAVAQRVTPEEVQLWYQIAIRGAQDLGLAPNPRAGFEMTLLRMLAFRPVEPGARGTAPVVDRTIAPAAPAPAAPARAVSPRAPRAATAVPAPASSAAALPGDGGALDAPRWSALIDEAGLRGLVRELAVNAVPVAHEEGRLRLGLAPAHEHFRNEALVRKLEEALAPRLGAGLRIQFETVSGTADTVAERARQERSRLQTKAEAAIAADPFVQDVVTTFGARVVAQSSRPNRQEE